MNLDNQINRAEFFKDLYIKYSQKTYSGRLENLLNSLKVMYFCLRAIQNGYDFTIAREENPGIPC